MSHLNRFPSEARRFTDPETVIPVIQVTDTPTINHHLYFTHPSCTPDNRTVFFVSYRTEFPNLYSAHLLGEITQLTDVDDLNPFSPVPSPDGSRVYYTAVSQVRGVEVATGQAEVMADFGNRKTGGASVSFDGVWLAVVVQQEKTSSIVAIHTGTGEKLTLVETEREIGHVQFSPTLENRILYSGDLHHRIWTVNFDGTDDRWLYHQTEEEWITHESWLGGEEVIFTHWPGVLKAVSLGGRERIVVALTAWHASARRDGSLIVCDTNHPDLGLHLIKPENGERRFLCHPRASSLGTQWARSSPADGPTVDVSIFRTPGQRLEAASYRATTYGPQWTHPHPSFSPDGQSVLFTSDRSGHSQVYLIRV